MSAVLVAAAFLVVPPLAVVQARAPGASVSHQGGKEGYRAFLRDHAGDAVRGRALFLNAQRLACGRCHTTDGSGGKPGPDLAAVGDEFSRRDLVESILEPSAHIAVGYGTTIVKTRHGDVIDGVVKDASADEVILMGADGRVTRVRVKDVARQQASAVSLMPDGLEAGLSHAEFADLIAYLQSLRVPASADAARNGMPVAIPEAPRPVSLVPLHGPEHRFDRPDWFGQVPGRRGSYLVCEHETGRVWLLETRVGGAGATTEKSLFGDFGREVRRGGATGLLGLAFHPRFPGNRRYYIQHQLVDGGRLMSVVSEKVADAGFRRDSGRPSRTIYRVACATDVHTGGGIAFGPDGFLYIGMGDTGPQGDPRGHAQDLRSPLGKMLRIDVDGVAGDEPYAIPRDNPFSGLEDERPEVWASGFREPWRFSFDRLTGDLWVGDVGQDRVEEVSVVRRGDNHGWNVFEGFEPFSARRRRPGAAYVPPVFAYARRYGNSITGGYVYRGDARSPFYGVYVCGDFTSKRIWGLRQDAGRLTNLVQIGTSPQEIASFGTDEEGRLYVVGYQGTVFELVFGDATFPAARWGRPADAGDAAPRLPKG